VASPTLHRILLCIKTFLAVAEAIGRFIRPGCPDRRPFLRSIRPTSMLHRDLRYPEAGTSIPSIWVCIMGGISAGKASESCRGIGRWGYMMVLESGWGRGGLRVTCCAGKRILLFRYSRVCLRKRPLRVLWRGRAFVGEVVCRCLVGYEKRKNAKLPADMLKKGGSRSYSKACTTFHEADSGREGKTCMFYEYNGQGGWASGIPGPALHSVHIQRRCRDCQEIGATVKIVFLPP